MHSIPRWNPFNARVALGLTIGGTLSKLVDEVEAPAGAVEAAAMLAMVAGVLDIAVYWDIGGVAKALEGSGCEE